ncbi:unnamed protein product [Colias eurytheme]|nr:unnamed protein product [Colias eurytheme]
MKILHILVITLLFCVSLFEANPIPKPDDSEEFEVHVKDGSRGWDGWIDTCDNCSVTNVGNGQDNTNIVFMKIKK